MPKHTDPLYRIVRTPEHAASAWPDHPGKPVLLIIDPDTQRAQNYASHLQDEYAVVHRRYGNDALDELERDQRRPAVAVVNSDVGRDMRAEDAIEELKRMSPETRVLAVMKAARRNSPSMLEEHGIAHDGYFNNLFLAGSDHVISRFDIGYIPGRGDHEQDYPGIREEVRVTVEEGRAAHGRIATPANRVQPSAVEENSLPRAADQELA